MNLSCNRSLFTAIRRGASSVKKPNGVLTNTEHLCHAANRIDGSIGARRCASTLSQIQQPLQDIDVPPPSLTPISSRHDAVKNAKPFSEFLTDTFARQHNYLRLSVTDRCNLKCTYCMPDGYKSTAPMEDFLTHHEMFYLSSLFVSQGVDKIRITGGEPFTHRDILPILRDIGSLKSRGLKDLCVTTNGVNLARKLDDVQKAGVTRINISLDSLDQFQYSSMAQVNTFFPVMRSIKQVLEMNALGASFKLKINVVVMRGVNENQIIPFVEFAKDRDIEVRFIEYMPFGGNKWEWAKVAPFKEMLGTVQEKYPMITRGNNDPTDASRTWQIPGFRGRVGFISSMTDMFCAGCNRLRITSDGNLKMCLHGKEEVSLRDVMRDEFNEGQRIDGEAFEAMRQVEMDRAEGRTIGVLGASGGEAKLLEIIGRAVKRKRAARAEISELDYEQNRSMTATGG